MSKFLLALGLFVSFVPDVYANDLLNDSMLNGLKGLVFKGDQILTAEGAISKSDNIYWENRGEGARVLQLNRSNGVIQSTVYGRKDTVVKTTFSTGGKLQNIVRCHNGNCFNINKKSCTQLDTLRNRIGEEKLKACRDFESEYTKIFNSNLSSEEEVKDLNQSVRDMNSAQSNIKINNISGAPFKGSDMPGISFIQSYCFEFEKHFAVSAVGGTTSSPRSGAQ